MLIPPTFVEDIPLANLAEKMTALGIPSTQSFTKKGKLKVELGENLCSLTTGKTKGTLAASNLLVKKIIPLKTFEKVLGDLAKLLENLPKDVQLIQFQASKLKRDKTTKEILMLEWTTAGKHFFKYWYGEGFKSCLQVTKLPKEKLKNKPRLKALLQLDMDKLAQLGPFVLDQGDAYNWVVKTEEWARQLPGLRFMTYTFAWDEWADKKDLRFVVKTNPKLNEIENITESMVIRPNGTYQLLRDKEEIKLSQVEGRFFKLWVKAVLERKDLFKTMPGSEVRVKYKPSKTLEAPMDVELELA